MTCELGTFGCVSMWHYGDRELCCRLTKCFKCKCNMCHSIRDTEERFELFCGRCYHIEFKKLSWDELLEVEWVARRTKAAGDEWLLREAVRTILPQPIWEEMEPHLISGEPGNDE